MPKFKSMRPSLYLVVSDFWVRSARLEDHDNYHGFVRRNVREKMEQARTFVKGAVYLPLKINGWNIIMEVLVERSFSFLNGGFVKFVKVPAVNLPGCILLKEPIGIHIFFEASSELEHSLEMQKVYRHMARWIFF